MGSQTEGSNRKQRAWPDARGTSRRLIRIWMFPGKKVVLRHAVQVGPSLLALTPPRAHLASLLALLSPFLLLSSLTSLLAPRSPHRAVQTYEDPDDVPGNGRCHVCHDVPDPRRLRFCEECCLCEACAKEAPCIQHTLYIGNYLYSVRLPFPSPPACLPARAPARCA